MGRVFRRQDFDAAVWRSAREERLKARLDQGDCTFCPPHQFENDHDRKDHRWVDGRRVKRKPRDTK